MFLGGFDRLREQVEMVVPILRQARESTVEGLCEADLSFRSSTLNDLVTEILNLTNQQYLLRPTNATRPDVTRQIRNYLAFVAGDEREACNREARAQLQQRTNAGNYVNQAALIILRLLRAGNPAQPVLQLNYTTLYFMQQRMMALRANCPVYLRGTLGFDPATTNTICTQTNQLFNPPTAGILVNVPRSFAAGPNFVRLAREASMTLIQPSPMAMGIPLIPPTMAAMGMMTAPPLRGIPLIPL